MSLLEGRRVLRVPSLRLPSSFIMALDARDFLTRITAAHMYVWRIERLSPRMMIERLCVGGRRRALAEVVKWRE